MEDDDEMQEAHAAMTGGGAASTRSARDEAVADARAAAASITHGLEEFDMDNYDNDDGQDNMQFFSVLDNDAPLLLETDPYRKEGEADSESEPEFYEIGPDDHAFMAVSCDEENCQLELMVYVEEDASMYVHHDVVLGAYPLCVEWISEAGTASPGSFAAIGLIDNSIQLWDLEDVEPLEPLRALGAVRKPTKGKKKKNPSSGAKAHDGPVLCLHGSTFNRNVLASGSADETLKVWDVRDNKCVHTYTHHKDKVQCARWHPTEQAVLLSAAFDRKLALLDVRQPNQAAMVPLPAEAESTIWSRHAPFQCLASVDNGGVICYDVRKIVAKDVAQSRLWEVPAHDVACTAVMDCPTPNVLVTCGLDGHAKVWNTSGGPQPMCIFDKELQAGPLFTCQSDPDSPAVMCFGGKCPVMWDLASESVLVGAFNLPATEGETQEA